jgi:hypothetical protein
MSRFGNLNGWEESKGVSPEVLQEKIQGSLSKQQVLDALDWDAEDEKTQKFLTDWIQGATDEQLEKFVSAISGSSTLAANQKLKVHLYPESENLPTFHSCNFTIDLPRQYPDYEIFKAKLEESLANAVGFQFI